MNRIDFYANDATIRKLMSRYGSAFERLGTQRFRLMQVLAADGVETESSELSPACREIREELDYLDCRARAGVIAAISRRMWEDS